MSCLVVFEGIEHPLQYLTALYQFIRGRRHYDTVHAVLYLRLDSWVRIELTWDGLRFDHAYEVEETYIKYAHYLPEVPGAALRAYNVLQLADVIGTRFRYSHANTLNQLLGKPAWFNCSSLISYILYGTMIDEPAVLRENL